MYTFAPAPAHQSLAVPASVARRAGAALIDLAVIVGTEFALLVVVGTAVRALGVSSLGGSPARLGAAAALGLAALRLLVFFGPVAYLYLTWRKGASVGMRAVRCRLQSADGGVTLRSSQLVK